MSAGLDHGVLPKRPQRPSATPFLISTTIIVAILAGVASMIFAKQRDASLIRADASRTSERRLTLSDMLAAIALSEVAERTLRDTGDPAAFARYATARRQVSLDLSALLDAMHRTGDTTTGVLRLRELVKARFAPGDALPGRSPADRRQDAALPAETELSRAIDAQGDYLLTINARRLVGDDERIEAVSAEIDILLWIGSVTTILAAIGGIWLWWHASSRHFELEIRAYDALARLRAVFTGTSDAIIVFTPSGRIEEANSAAENLLGYDMGTLEGCNITGVIDLDDVSHEQRQGFLNGAITMPTRLERTARDHAGNPIPVDVALGLIPFANGTRIVASLRDFSERRAAERMKDDFISTISHELRTPLTSVVGALGLLREGAAGALPDAATRLIEIAENNSRRLIRLVNDILDIDQLGSGRVRLAIEPVDLRTVAARAREGAEGIAAPRAVRIVLEPCDDPVIVPGDAERLLQVIGNLLSNAVRFSPAGGTVALALDVRGREAFVRVDDDGPGVPAEFRERLFGRFTQSSAGAAIPGGTGLGLAISREIARAHGGEIWYSDRREGGARFCFSLPIDEQATADSPRRILLCEDDARIAALMRELIEGEGYIVNRCGSVGEARAMARSGRYDALLLDLSLPDAKGLEAVETIREQPETSDLPLIVVSGSAALYRLDPGAAAFDVADWIDKPIDHDRLLRALDVALARADDNRPVLLHVEDDADVREVVALALADCGRILQAGTIAAARTALAASRPAAVILDLDLPDGSGLDLVPLLAAGTIPAIVYSAGSALPAIGGPIEAVLVKSARSPMLLSETIRAIMAWQARQEEARRHG